MLLLASSTPAPVPTVAPSPPPVGIPIGPRDWFTAFGGDILFTFGVMAILLWRHWAKPRLSYGRLRLRYSVRQDLEVKSVLSQILALMKADRVLLCEIHNGSNTSARRSDLRVTATQEDAQPGVERIASTVFNLPLARLASEMVILEDGNLHSLSRDQDLPEGCRRHLASIGVWGLREQLLMDGSEVLGILVIHYCHPVVPSGGGILAPLRGQATTENPIPPLTAGEMRQYELLRFRLISTMKHRSVWVEQLREWLGL